MPAPQAPTPAIPIALNAADQGQFGLFSGLDFRLGTGRTEDQRAPRQALWFFHDEPIALPLPGLPLAGYSPSRRVYDDVATWHAETPIGSALDAPPLVWTGASHFVDGGQLALDASSLTVGTTTIPVALAPRHPLNRSYFDSSSAAYLNARTVRIRGDWQNGRLTARCVWPEDFRLPEVPDVATIAADPLAFRRLVRTGPHGGAEMPFSTTMLWQRPGTRAVEAGRPVLAFILNGAQGDDDEAHAGHFAAITGRIGDKGAIHDWLAANYYTLDSESEKGIIAAPVPLDNYLADLNAGQAWYRPSCMLVAVLREERTAAHVQSALGRVFNHFYRHRFSYQHARNNCTGISISTLRSLGWQIPERGPESWLRATIGLPLAALTSGSVKRGKAVFDYLTEDRTRLYPAVAFEEIGADLLGIATGSLQRRLGEFEKMLASDMDALLFVRIPQLPSSRPWGDYPVVDSREYDRRIPKDPAERQIIPVGPRPFPADFIDPDAPREPLLRSDYAVAGYALLLLGIAVALVF